MFTIIPSLYLFGVNYYRQWYANSTKSSLEKPETISNVPKVKSSKKKSHRQQQQQQQQQRRRKTSTSELNHDEITYLKNQTGFTEEQILLWYRDYLYDCPDGKLSQTKFIEIYQQFYKKGRVDKFCEYAFRLFNKDGSGYLDFIEFLRAVSLTSLNDPEHKIGLFFSMYDLDRNGRIDENEMRTCIESIYDLLGIDIRDPSRIDCKVSQIFSTVDCDRMGYLSKEQFSIACQNDRHIRKLLISNTKILTSHKNEDI